MQDYIVRAITKDGLIKASAALTTELVQELQKRQGLFPVASAALGRTATMGAMMGLTLKEPHHHTTIRIMGDGPLGEILVDVDGQGGVRGMVDHPEVMLPLNDLGKLDVARAVGAGTLYIGTDLGLKHPYEGQVPIISGELAEDFTYYYATSEQIPAAIGLGVLVNRDRILASGGYMIQLMPEATESRIQEIEEQIGQIPSVTESLQAGYTPESLLSQLLGDELEVLEQRKVQFACTCSRERSDSMLISLGTEELRAMIEEEGEAEIQCHFCQKNYYYSQRQLLALMDEMES